MHHRSAPMAWLFACAALLALAGCGEREVAVSLLGEPPDGAVFRLEAIRFHVTHVGTVGDTMRDSSIAILGSGEVSYHLQVGRFVVGLESAHGEATLRICGHQILIRDGGRTVVCDGHPLLALDRRQDIALGAPIPPKSE